MPGVISIYVYIDGVKGIKECKKIKLYKKIKIAR